MDNKHKRRVVITGIGVVTSAGNGKKKFWENCLKANCNVSYIPEEWGCHFEPYSKLWSPLPKINFAEEGINRIEQLQSDNNQLLALVAARQAIEDANINYTVKDKKKNTYTLENNLSENFGVYIGTGNGGLVTLIDGAASHFRMPIFEKLKAVREKIKFDPSLIDEIIEFSSTPRLVNRFSVPMIMPNACSAKIGIKYSLTGPNTTYCAACASGTLAIGNAYRSIKSGSIDKAVAGGVEFFGDDYGAIFRVFDVVKTLVRDCRIPQLANCPFDENRSGFLFSEGGSAMLIVEELEHAKNRNAEIYAEITGFSESFDAYNIMMISPNYKEIEKMVLGLLNQRNLKPEDIDYINAHGTGTKTNDSIEAKLIKKLFGKNVLVNSTKSIIGHTIGASGAIEASIVALSIKNKTTHICNNLQNPIENLNFVRQVDSYDICKAISQSFAFGGHNAAILFEDFRD